MLPLIDTTIRETVYSDDVWFSVVNQLCLTFLTITKTCSESGLEIPSGINMDIEIPADYAQKYNKGMVDENKLISKSADAQKHLNEAYSYISAMA